MRYVIIFLFFCVYCQAQKIKERNDFSFTLHEETVNKVLAALGEISGTNEYEVMFMKGKYHWKIVNPLIQIRPDSTQFYCDAYVNVGPFNYKTQVKGDVKIIYDEKADKISIKITRAIFELYTVIFDKRIHIKDIHLEEHFKDPFLFDGPRSYETSMDITLPDSVVKKLYIIPSDCDFKVKYREVCAVCEVMVSDKPFRAPLQAAPTPNIPATSVKTVQAASSKTTQAQKK